ncbi:imelysin family protein [Ilumatobacter nonamiensis]|uniref:imelysin family protein n=1 Tax=Ilumatobacter nonamiensis TaxID=467093 RepID=UPI00034C5D6F|nr:imelysin family protein [Ilumatobacter nonamiensis]
MTRPPSRSRVRPANVVPLAFAAGLVVSACGDSGPSRSEVVGSATETIVPARYAELAAAAETVVHDVQTWCDGEDATAATDSISAARDEWLTLRPYSFGPANERRSMFIIDPNIREDDVDELGADGAAVDADSLRNLAGADQRGWQAVEHLVAGELTDRRCEYALGASQLTADELAAVADEWVEYGSAVAEDDEAANIALRNIVSESLFSVQMVIDEPNPDTDAVRLEGVRLALVGEDGTGGIAELLSDDLVERLTAELDAGDATALQITINTEVVGELGTTVNFSDADGDG